MGLAAVVLSIAGYVLFIARFTRSPIAILPAIVTSAIIVVLYVSALAGALWLAACTLLVGGLMALVGALAPSRWAVRAVGRAAAEPGIVILFLCALFLWFRVNHAAYYNWDEFSHWAVVTREILRLDGLPLATSPMQFPAFAPGAALFQYYVAVFAGYSEGVTIFAQALLTLSMLAVLFQPLSWRQPLAIAATALTGVALIFWLGNGLKNILIDHLVGVYFGGAILIYALAPSRGALAASRALPVLTALPLLKAVGTFLALVAAAVIGVMMIRDWRRTPGNRTAWLIAAFVLIAAPLVADSSWAMHVRDAGLQQVFARHFSPADLLQTLSSARTDRDAAILSSFSHAWFDQPVQRTVISTATWIALLAAAFIAAYWRASTTEFRGDIVVCSVALFIGLGLYSAGLLMLYLYSFSDYEATRAAQFARYHSIYILGSALVALAFLSSSSKTAVAANRWMRRVIYTVAFVALAALFRKVEILPIWRTYLRAELHEHSLAAIQRIPASKSVYLIWQYTDGNEYWMIRFEIFPRRVNRDCWSLGKPADADDVWTCNLSARDLRTRLASFDYVLIAKTNSALKDVLAPFVVNDTLTQDWAVYVVEKSADGTIVLRRVP
jgi:hypothetical protein